MSSTLFVSLFLTTKVKSGGSVQFIICTKFKTCIMYTNNMAIERIPLKEFYANKTSFFSQRYKFKITHILTERIFITEKLNNRTSKHSIYKGHFDAITKTKCLSYCYNKSLTYFLFILLNYNVLFTLNAHIY